MNRRGSGILMHVTSLPAPYGVGDLGPWAYKFADFLAQTKQSFWQILPLNPTDPAYDNSPYHSISAFAGNSLLISPELMVQDGLLSKTDVEKLPEFSEGRVDYESVIAYKKRLFHLAYQCFKKKRNHDYERFCSENSHWLEDFSLFISLKTHFHGRAWSEWSPEIRDRQPEALRSLKNRLRDRIKMEKFLQYLFVRQWFSLKHYCNRKGIQIIGDIPIYVDYDSADLWTNPHLFKLDNEKKPYAVSGVPPDYFSATGQLWGNPVYQWDVLKKGGFEWWIQRMEHNLNLLDMVRIDHFRGLIAYWEVAAGEETAVNGQWVEAPVQDFFNALLKRFCYLPIIAEDLGVITPDVREVMHHFELPGMKVLLFAFGEDHPMHPYLPHTYEKDSVVYTGTHDNNTIMGWFDGEAKPQDKERLFSYLGREVPVEEVHWEFIRLAMGSVANTAIIPMQDIMGLGEEARMNRPATADGNWRWRLLSGHLTPSLAGKLAKMTEIYGRA